jgi:hypothetical protein
VFSHSLYFSPLGISWVPPVHFGWPCLATTLWNSHWLLVGFLLSGLHWVPWYSWSLFSWSLGLSIHFIHFALNPAVLYFLGGNSFLPFFFFPYFH